VVTAKDEDYATGMLASWVSQASFDPPGVTVSIRKSRTLETMLMPGNPFAISMVAESQAKRVRKVMSKPFTPGADRLANLKTHPSPVSGTPVLDTSNAILDCTVVSRMEAGDHWVVYGHVQDGQLQNDKELTAVMHRKAGNHY
jgi:flavin reductase (DIM6/NTAB) family NADH-FMN oxidoreductase RutF